MSNLERARELMARVRQKGVDEFCVCAGSRNSPLLAVLGASGLRLFSFVDERSAAFFALGRIKLRGRPAAVVTTSGTAVAELLPAAVEGYYASLPLVLVTADRPARFRGTGAPQCIEQEGIFGRYAATDIEGWNSSSPLHINIEFDEPLLDGRDGPIDAGLIAASKAARTDTPVRSPASAAAPSVDFERPLLILSALAATDRDLVREFALRLNAPVYAEPLSGLREDSRLRSLLVTAGERMLDRGRFDGVIRIGGVPALRFWRDLEESRSDLPVISFSRSPFTGLSRGLIYPLEHLPRVTGKGRGDDFFARDATTAAKIAAILDEEPESEPAAFRRISRQLPEGSRIYLGNSLPIREWDLFAARQDRRFVYEANRGANGIDGQLSTFFGWCAPDAGNTAVVGDLTAIYDMNAPWIVPQLDAATQFRIVIINNGGGRIFSRVASLTSMDKAVRERIVENAHAFRFEPWTKMWGLEDAVVEVVPDSDSTRRVWKRYDELWS